MKKSWAALLCVVYLTSVAGVVGAENNSSTSVDSVNESQNTVSNEQSRRMKDITVTATRTEALVRDVPIATTIISQEEIKDRQYRNLEQALQSVPGVAFSTDAHGGQNITMRGAESRHTLILIDGRRVTGELTKTRANAMGWLRQGMDNVERIEIIRGPSSALYGSEANGGVINIITKQSRKPSVEVNTEISRRDASSATGYNFNVLARSGQQGKWNGSIGAGIRRNIAGNNDSGSDNNYHGDRIPLHFDVSYQAGKRDKFSFFIDRETEDLDMNTRKGSALTQSVDKNTTTTSTGLRWNGRRGRSLLMVQSYYNHYKDTYDQYKRTGGIKKLSIWDEYYNKEWITDAQVNTSINKKNLLTYGVQFRRQEAISTRINNGSIAWSRTREGITDTAGKATINYGSYFVQHQWKPSRKWIIIPAVRYDTSNTFDSHWSPKIGVTYKANDSLRFKMNYGAGYSTPGMTEMYHHWLMASNVPRGRLGAFDIYLQGNPNLKPESSYNFDFSVEKDWKRTNVKASYFHNVIKNYIESGANRIDMANRRIYISYSNLPRAVLQGVELSVNHKLNDKWDVFGNYTYLDAKNDVTHNRLLNRGRHVFSGGVNYHQGRWTGAFWGNYYINYLDGIDAIVVNPRLSIPKKKNIQTWNVMVTRQLNDNASMYVGVENIFGEKQDLRDIHGATYRMGLNLRM